MVDGVSEEEVERSINQLLAMEAFSRDGAFSVAQQLNEAIAGGDWKLYADFARLIKVVDASDVIQTAEKYLKEDQSTVGYYIPA